MSVDERRRLQLADAAKRALGDDEGITLTELLPPVGWGDVATKQDLVLVKQDLVLVRRDLVALEQRLEQRIDSRLELFEQRLEARFERGFRQVIVTMAPLVIAGFFATIAATVLR